MACCVGCLVLIVAVFLGGSLLLRMAVGPSNQAVTSLPAGYPQELKPYRLSDAKSIVYAPGSSRSKLMKILLSPARLLASIVGAGGSKDADSANGFTGAIETYSDQLEGFDSVTMTWKNLPARRDDAALYYENLFKKNGMSTQAFHNENTMTDIVFAKKASAAMQLSLTDDPKTPTLDGIELTVEYLIQK